MKAVDTNVLLRILIDDPTNMKQCLIARRFVAELDKIHVSQITQIELLWVLETQYSFKKSDIISLLEMMLTNDVLALQSRKVFSCALQLYHESTADFSDCLILADAIAEHVIPLITFDKKLAKLNHTIIPV